MNRIELNSKWITLCPTIPLSVLNDMNLMTKGQVFTGVT